METSKRPKMESAAHCGSFILSPSILQYFLYFNTFNYNATRLFGPLASEPSQSAQHCLHCFLLEKYFHFFTAVPFLPASIQVFHYFIKSLAQLFSSRFTSSSLSNKATQLGRNYPNKFFCYLDVTFIDSSTVMRAPKPGECCPVDVG